MWLMQRQADVMVGSGLQALQTVRTPTLVLRVHYFKECSISNYAASKDGESKG
jgi:hypothetical protein